MSITPWGGVYPAPICPMSGDQSVDYASLSRYYRWLGSRPGVAGLAVNINAGEGTFLSLDERRRVIRATREATPSGIRLVGGLVASSTAEGIEELRKLKDDGADAALVFPVRDWIISRQAGAAERYFERLTDAVDLPLFIYQSPHTRGAAAYDLQTLENLIKLPNIVGMKNAVWEVRRYQEEYLRIRELRPDLAVLSANDSHVLATLAIGADGVLLGLAGLVPDLIVELVESLSQGSLNRARQADRTLWPIAQAIYHTAPYAARHIRTKAALKMLGHIESDMVREPLLPLTPAERAQVAEAIAAAGLMALA